jgi:nucleoside-diphosphate-sugar epimerase
MDEPLPDKIETEAMLDEVLTRPYPPLVEFIRTLRGPLVILGAGGKIGPSLAVLAHRAAEETASPLEIIAVSRFSDPATRRWLEEKGVRTLACDLMIRSALDRLPDSANIIYLVGMKFGTAQNPAHTWAVNTLAPAHVCQRYASSRIVALSTGNVYPLVPVESQGAVETDPLLPLGEYANSCIARERIFEYYAHENGTPATIIRLNYALDLRYGVLHDLAARIHAHQAVDVTMGYVNCIWQGDANDMILRALGLAQAPALHLNVSGSEVLSIRALAGELAAQLEAPLQITGSEAPTALLSNSGLAIARLGAPRVSTSTMLRWSAHWIKQGGRSLNKPTHFEVRDGVY